MNSENRETRDKIHIRITRDYAKWCFNHFNDLIFGFMVPDTVFCLANFERIASRFTPRKYDVEDSDEWVLIPTIYLNENLFLTDQEWQDVILHEMIHIYLWDNNAEDEQPHGLNFLATMRYINKTYKRHIRVRYRGLMHKKLPKMPCKPSYT